MKRRMSIDDPTSTKKFHLTSVSLDDFRDNILSIIIRNLSLPHAINVMLISKRFHRLVWENATTVLLQRRLSAEQFGPIIRKLPSIMMRTLVAWYSSSTPVLIDDDVMASIARFTSLRTLILGHQQLAITDIGLQSLIPLVNLGHLEIDLAHISLNALHDVLIHLCHLSVLRVRGIIVDPTDTTSLEPLSHLPLTRVGLWPSTGKINDIQFSFFAGLTQLTELIVGSTTRADPNSFTCLAKLHNLQHLGIFHDDIDDFSITQVFTLTRLVSLHLGGCYKVNDDAMAGITNLVDLDNLALTQGQCLTGALFTHLSQLSLSAFHISNCPLVTDNFAQLSGLTNLTRLDLEDSQCFNPIMDVIANCSNLEEIRLVNLPCITDSGLMQIARMFNIRNVFIKGCPEITRESIDILSGRLSSNRDVTIRWKPCSNN